MEGRDFSRFLTKKNPPTENINDINNNNYQRVYSPQLLLENNRIKNIQIEANPALSNKNILNQKEKTNNLKKNNIPIKPKIQNINDEKNDCNKYSNNNYNNNSNNIIKNNIKANNIDNNMISINNINNNNNINYNNNNMNNTKYSFDKRVLFKDSRVNDFTYNTRINFELPSSKKSSTKDLLNNNNSKKTYINNTKMNNSQLSNINSQKKSKEKSKKTNMNNSNISNSNSKLNPKSNKRIHLNNSFDYNSPATSYLNRRHTQEMERLKKFKENRDQIYSFAPKINKNSEKIVKKLQKEKFIPIIPKEEIDNIYDENYYKNKKSFVFDNYNKSNFKINESEVSYQNTSPNKPIKYDFGDQKKLIDDITHYLNTKQENENNPNFLLNHDSRAFLLERMKAIQIKQKENI